MILAPTLTLSAGSGAAIARPTFSRDFAGEKSLNNGTGPAITFTRASNATFFNASGVLQTASNDQPRFDHDPATGASRGLLIEEARTNHCTNSEASGAIGTNGPTGWFINGTNLNGLTRTITTGTLNGMAYIDVRWNGTTTSGPFNIQFDARPPTGPSALSGQSWTGSAYLAITSGAVPSGASLNLRLTGRDASNVLVEENNLTISATASLVRYTSTRTLSSASTSSVTLDIRVNNVPSATAVDFTLRIAAPQLEEGAFPTSYIPTTSAQATRSADSAVVTPISGFYNQAEGTLFAEAVVLPRNANIASISINNAETDRLTLYTASAGTMRWFINSNNVVEYNSESAAITSGAIGRIAGAYRVNDVIAATNGILSAADTSIPLPPVSLTHFFIGRTATTFPPLNGHIRKIAYYPRRLSNALLQQLTT